MRLRARVRARVRVRVRARARVRIMVRVRVRVRVGGRRLSVTCGNSVRTTRRRVSHLRSVSVVSHTVRYMVMNL